MSVTVVTGASSGIGRSLARRLAIGGETIVALARRKALLDTLAEEIVAGGGRALAIECDVTDREMVRAAMSQAEVTFGQIDRLLACAGGGERVAVDDFGADHVARALDLNVGGTVLCIEALLPAMLRRGSGHIVAVSSLAANRGLPGAAAYSAAKAALSNLIESLRIDLAPRGIAVTLICPGFVRTSSSASKKRKPFQVDLETASKQMCRAILARRRYYAFPLPLVIGAGFGRILPATLYDHLLSGAGNPSTE